jgi:hypothetical protein
MTRSVEAPRVGLAAVLCWLALALYGGALLALAALFIHERIGIWMPIALLLAPVAVAVWSQDGRRAAAVSVGFAAAVLIAGGFFWARYAFYTSRWATLALLTVAAVATTVLLVTGLRVSTRPVAPALATFCYSAAAITFGQGVPDQDPMRPKILQAAARLQVLAPRIDAYASAHGGRLPLTLEDVMPGGADVPGYRLSYDRGQGTRTAADGFSYRLEARPTAYGSTGLHGFVLDESRRLRYTRRPRPPRLDDPSWD